MITKDLLKKLTTTGLEPYQFCEALRRFAKSDPEIHDKEFLAASVAGEIEDHDKARVVYEVIIDILSHYSRPDFIKDDVHGLGMAYKHIFDGLKSN